MARLRRRAVRLEPGIRRVDRPKGSYLEAFTRIRGRLISATFPLDERDRARAWIIQQKRDHFVPSADGTTRRAPRSFWEQIGVYLADHCAGKATAPQMEKYLREWAELLGRDRDPRTITTADVTRVITQLLTTPRVAAGRGRSAPHGLDSATIVKMRGRLRHFFNAMYPDIVNPVKRARTFAPKAPAVRDRPPATIADLLAAMPDYQSHKRGTAPTQLAYGKLYAAVLAYTGLPPGLLFALERDQVAFDRARVPQTIHVQRIKGAGVEARDLVLTEQGRAAVAAFDAADAYGKLSSVSALNVAIKRAARRIGDRAGLRHGGITTYLLRHAFGAQAYRVTRDAATVGRLLLHAENSPTTARYVAAANVDVDAAAVAAIGAAAPVPVPALAAPIAPDQAKDPYVNPAKVGHNVGQFPITPKKSVG